MQKTPGEAYRPPVVSFFVIGYVIQKRVVQVVLFFLSNILAIFILIR